MKKINPILILFFAIIFVIVLGGWYFIQSKTFGRTVSRFITKVSEEQIQAKLTFKNISINLFPPGFTINHVKMSRESDDMELKIDMGSLSVNFDLIDIPRRKLSIYSIDLEKGNVEINTKTKSESKKINYYSLIKNELNKLPFHLQAIKMLDSQLLIDQNLVQLKKAQISQNKKFFNLDIISEKIFIPNLELPPIDESIIRAEIDGNKINIEKLVLFSEYNRLDFIGEIVNYLDFDKLQIDSTIDAQVYLGKLNEYKLLEILEIQDGLIELKGPFQYKNEKIVSTVEGLIKNFDSKIIDAEKVKLSLLIQNEKIILKETELNYEDQKAKLIKPTVLYDFSSGRYLHDDFLLSVQNLDMNNILQVLGDSLKPLKGKLDGQLVFSVKGKNLYFNPLDGFKINNLGLQLNTNNSKPTRILNTKELKMENTSFALEDGVFKLDLNLKGLKSEIHAAGEVSKDNVYIDVSKSNISFDDLGDVADLKLKGEGLNDIKVRGPLNNVILDFSGKFSNFEFLGYRLGDVDHDFSINLNKNEVTLNQINAQKGSYQYNGNGSVNYGKLKIDINVEIPKIGFESFKDVVFPLSDGFKILPEDFDADFSGRIQLTCKDQMSNFKVNAEVDAKQISAYRETIDESSFNFIFEKRKLKFEDIKIKKDIGVLDGFLIYDLDQKITQYNFNLSRLYSKAISLMRRLPIAVDYNLSGHTEGYYSEKFFETKGKLDMTQTEVRGKRLGDSHLDFEWNKKTKRAFGNILGDWIKVDLKPFLARGGFEGSIDLNVTNLPLLLVGLFGDNPRLLQGRGNLDFVTKVYSSDGTFESLDLDLWLKDLNLKSMDLDFTYSHEDSQIKFENGTLKKWDFNLKNGGVEISTQASGNLFSEFRSSMNFNVNARYLELFSNYIKRSQGAIVGKLVSVFKNKKLDINGEVTGQNISVASEVIPFPINNLNFKSMINPNRIEIELLNFRSESGLVRLNGDIFLDDLDPELNLRYALEKATFPVKSKSVATLSGQGLIFGSQRPYIVNGDIMINKALIVNEFSDWLSKEGENSKFKYLPKENISPLAGLIKMDLKIQNENPLNMNNSFVDVFMNSDLYVTGDLFDPKLDGRVYLSGLTSKAFFKNNDYQLTKGEFVFSSSRSFTMPDFDIVANSTINNYKISARALGNPESFSFDLLSDPVLPKNSILSLIAFGYTEDISNTISTDERQKLSQVGVGSFLFDQFKVTDIVKKQFGLQIKLGTEFVQANSSMLQGRGGQETSTGLGRTRTATKIEVRKRLSETMNLSVSSTVGGSIGQRQSMNLNYGLSKHLQLEGVYELRTNEEGVEDLIDNSIGGDIKWRWSFK